MGILINWLVSALAILATAYLLPGIHVDTFVTALVLAVVLAIANVVIKPILVLLTLPITILTFGLFTLVINALLVLGATYIVPGFTVDGFLWALTFSIVLSLISWALSTLFNK